MPQGVGAASQLHDSEVMIVVVKGWVVLCFLGGFFAVASDSTAPDPGAALMGQRTGLAPKGPLKDVREGAY
jgi:hypothetical protein